MTHGGGPCKPSCLVVKGKVQHRPACKFHVSIEDTTHVDIIRDLLKINKNAIHPGKGEPNAKLVRSVCEVMGWDEDEFLPRFIRKDKKKWGL